MSLQSSRFESQQIVNSFNIFCDTEKTDLYGKGNTKGDDITINFEGNSIEAGDGEIIRLSLTNFNMFNTIYNVNVNNSKFRVRVSTSSGIIGDSIMILLKHQNYKNLNNIATTFVASLEAVLEGFASGIATALAGTPVARTFTASDITPTDSGVTGVDTTGDRLFNVLYTLDGGHDHHISGFELQCDENDGDSYAIMGGARVDGNTSSTATKTGDNLSFKIVVTAKTIQISGFFPMTLKSDPYVYLRCGQTNNGLEQSTLSKPVYADDNNPDIVNSDILGKIFRGTEMINFHTSQDEYFINLQQRRLSSLRLFLTDKNRRPLGRLFANNEQGDTASGRSSSTETAGTQALNAGIPENLNQATLGNLFFTAVIKCEIIKVRDVKKLETDPIPKPLPARQAQAVYQVQDYGLPRY